MGVDGGYALTRRRGRPGVVSRVTATVADPETGEKTETVVSATYRWVVKQPTQYHRLIRAEAVQQRIGDTTFIFWIKDVEADFTTIRQEDWITFDGRRYEVVSSVIEDTAFVVTAKETAS